MPSRSMVVRNVCSNSSEKTKIRNQYFCGKKQESMRSSDKKIQEKAERLLTLRRANQDVTQEDDQRFDEQKGQQKKRRSNKGSYSKFIFDKRRRDAVMIDWTNKVMFSMEFKRTPDQRRDYRK